MVMIGRPRHEVVDARVWSPNMGTWWPLAPWNELQIDGREDWSVDQATITIPADHPQAPRLRLSRHIPVPVSFNINGVYWDGYVTTVESGKREDGTEYITATMSSDHKHFHRALARGPVASAADSSSETVTTTLGELTRRLVSGAAVRTGLPTYVIIDDDGDPVEVEVRTEDYVADVLETPLGGSDSFIRVQKLLPGRPIPGVSTAYHYEGVMERQWEEVELAKGTWPNAATSSRIIGKALDSLAPPLPENSWRGKGLMSDRGIKGANTTEGICWVPFETVVDRPLTYYGELDPAYVYVTTLDRLRTDAVEGRPMHVTRFAAGAFAKKLTLKLDDCVTRGLLYRTNGTKFASSAEAYSYIGSGEAYAWKDGSSWVLANRADFDADNKRYAARGTSQKQTPGVLVWQHAGRDRRGIVFSSAPGGGLKAWSTSETAPDGAMLIAGGQLDEQTIAALRGGYLEPQATVEQLTSETAAAYISTGLPDTVEQIDVNIQPHATIAGTEVSFNTAGGRVDIAKAGPFFFREKYMNLSSSGGANPIGEIAREWAKSQGATSMALTPGHHNTAVFGEDVRLPDGRIVPGWMPGDRVSFVDRDARVSEVVMGYSITVNAESEFTAVPVLGREVNGVMAELGRRLRASERTSTKSLLAPARRVPKTEIEAVADDRFSDDAMDWRQSIKGDLDSASEFSAAAAAASGESSRYSKLSNQYSEESRAHSEKSLEYSEESKTYSEQAGVYSQESLQHSSDSLQHSRESAGYSATAKTYSDDAAAASGQASTYSSNANNYSLAAKGSAEDAEGFRRLAEEERRKAENARSAAETARSGAETARSKAETARAGAEGDRALAEAARAAAEGERKLAETARSKAESERARAERGRSDAEAARDKAEKFRNEAESKRAAADLARQQAVDAANKAVNAVNASQDAAILIAQNGVLLQHETATRSFTTRGDVFPENDWITGQLSSQNWGIGGTRKSKFTFTAKGTWAGQVSVMLVTKSGDIDTHEYGVGPGYRTNSYSTEGPVDIEGVTVIISMYWGNVREFVFPYVTPSATTTPGTFLSPGSIYDNSIEGTPFTLSSGAVKFPFRVRPRGSNVYTSTDGSSWSLSSNTVGIAPGVLIKPPWNKDGLDGAVKFEYVSAT